jgi:hypothetical protein
MNNKSKFALEIELSRTKLELEETRERLNSFVLADKDTINRLYQSLDEAQEHENKAYDAWNECRKKLENVERSRALERNSAGKRHGELQQAYDDDVKMWAQREKRRNTEAAAQQQKIETLREDITNLLLTENESIKAAQNKTEMLRTKCNGYMNSAIVANHRRAILITGIDALGITLTDVIRAGGADVADEETAKAYRKGAGFTNADALGATK